MDSRRPASDCIGAGKKENMLKGEVGQRARQYGWFDPNRAPLSNVLMTGGRLYIPPAEYTDIFLPAYARDIGNGVDHFLIERVTEKSRWFADFDCPADVSVGAAEWEIIAKKIQETLIGISRQRTCFIVLKVRESECSKKMGIHLIAPDVVATMEQMMNWRETYATC
jgi:hypothetical protein